MDQPPPYPAAAPGQAYPPPGAYPPAGAAPMDSKAMPPQGQQPGYPPTQYGMGTTTVVMQQPAVVQVVSTNSPYPVSTTCPHCRANVVTSVSFSDGLLVWLVAGGLCIIGLWLGCCLIPFCINDLKDVTHSCPNCHAVIGHFKRM